MLGVTVAAMEGGMKRKRYSPELKAKVVIVAIHGLKTASEIAELPARVPVRVTTGEQELAGHIGARAGRSGGSPGQRSVGSRLSPRAGAWPGRALCANVLETPTPV
jgi:hypothetical protein